MTPRHPTALRSLRLCPICASKCARSCLGCRRSWGGGSDRGGGELIDIARRYRATTRISAPLFLIRTPTHPKAVFRNWSHLTSGGFEEHIVSGNAFSILAMPAVKIVGTRLAET